MDAVSHLNKDVHDTCPFAFMVVKHTGWRITVRQKTAEFAQMPASDRGHVLLEWEKLLRKRFGPYEVFLEPQGDINKLRLKLRGVKVE